MYSNKHVIHEPSKSIPIISPSKNNTHEYSLKQNFFDPSKSSPPNEFMLKLKIRSSVYGSRQECR
jgi:hypothetical protein